METELSAPPCVPNISACHSGALLWTASHSVSISLSLERKATTNITFSGGARPWSVPSYARIATTSSSVGAICKQSRMYLTMTCLRRECHVKSTINTCTGMLSFVLPADDITSYDAACPDHMLLHTGDSTYAWTCSSYICDSGFRDSGIRARRRLLTCSSRLSLSADRQPSSSTAARTSSSDHAENCVSMIAMLFARAMLMTCTALGAAAAAAEPAAGRHVSVYQHHSAQMRHAT
jgi:hypothetical protein